jgi:hypothetical protein
LFLSLSIALYPSLSSPYLQCTVRLFVHVPFPSLASLGAHAVCILCCAFDDESVELVASLYFDDTERERHTESSIVSIKSFFVCYCCFCWE